MQNSMTNQSTELVFVRSTEIVQVGSTVPVYSSTVGLLRLGLMQHIDGCCKVGLHDVVDHDDIYDSRGGSGGMPGVGSGGGRRGGSNGVVCFVVGCCFVRGCGGFRWSIMWLLGDARLVVFVMGVSVEVSRT